MTSATDEFNYWFAQKLKELRKQHGWSQGQLGKKIAVDPQRISKYEQGKSSPPVKIMIKIADAFGVSLDYLMKGSGPERAQALKNPRLSVRLERITDLSPRKIRTILVAIMDALVKNHRLEAGLAQGYWLGPYYQVAHLNRVSGRDVSGDLPDDFQGVEWPQGRTASEGNGRCAGCGQKAAGRPRKSRRREPWAFL